MHEDEPTLERKNPSSFVLFGTRDALKMIGISFVVGGLYVHVPSDNSCIKKWSTRHIYHDRCPMEHWARNCSKQSGLNVTDIIHDYLSGCSVIIVFFTEMISQTLNICSLYLYKLNANPNDKYILTKCKRKHAYTNHDCMADYIHKNPI